MSVKAESQRCELCSVQPAEDTESVWENHRRLVIATSTVLFATALAVEYLTKNLLYGRAIFLVVILFSGREIIDSAFRSIIRGRLDVNFLMTVAAFGAFAIGEADEGAAVLYLLSLAGSLEDMASDRGRASLAGLFKLSPSTATVRGGGREVEKNIEDVEVG